MVLKLVYVCHRLLQHTRETPFLLIISYHKSEFISFSNGQILWLKFSHHCSGYLADTNVNKAPGETKQVRKCSVTCSWSNEVQEQTHFLFHFNSFSHLCILRFQFWIKFLNKNWNVALDKRKFSYHSWSENSFNTSWNQTPVLGSCHMVLSIVHWLISSPFSSKAVQYFCRVFPWRGSHFPHKRKW